MKPEQTTPGRFRRLQHPLVCVIVALASCLGSPIAQAQPKTPNIVVIWGDDVGWTVDEEFSSSSASSWARSENSRRGRRLAASASTRRWRA